MTLRRFIEDCEQLAGLGAALERSRPRRRAGEIELQEIAPGIFGAPLPSALPPPLPGPLQGLRHTAVRVRTVFAEIERHAGHRRNTK